MTTIQMTVQYNDPKTYFVDPDGPNTPVTLQFPDTADVPNGSRIRIVNTKQSNTPITLLASGADTIAKPGNPAIFATSQEMIISEMILQYQSAGTEWRVIGHGTPNLTDAVIEIFSFAAYGGLVLSAPISNSEVLDGTWKTVNVFDQVKFTPERGILQNVANSSLAFEFDGVYLHNLVLNYTHNESNSSRTTQLRAYNLTDGVPAGAGGLIIPIARNQPGTLISISFLQEVSEAEKNKEFVMQVGNGDTVNLSAVPFAGWSAHAISEWREPLV